MLRTARIAAIKKVIARDEDPVLQSLFMNIEILEVMSRRDIFDIWYGMKSLDSYDDSVLELLTILLRADVDTELKKLTKKSEIEEEERPLAKIIPFQRVDRKNEFLDELPLSTIVSRQFRSIFDDFAEYEGELGKDISDMTKQEFVVGVQRLGLYNRESIRNILLKMLRYFKWCREKGYSGQEYDISVSDIDIADAIQEKLYPDPDALFKAVSKRCILNDAMLTPVCVCLTWMGFSPKEMADIKNEDYDPASNTILGRKIPEAFRNEFLSYSRAEEVSRECGNGYVTMYIYDAGYLLKTMGKTKGKEPKRISTSSIAAPMSDAGFRGRDIATSRCFYDLAEIRKDREVTDEDFKTVFGISGSRSNVNTALSDRRIEFNAFIEAFSL